MTIAEFELISDAVIYLVFSKGMRQNFLHSKIYREANNKYLKSYDSNQESKHIIYLVNKNLWSHAKFLPTGAFKWIDSKGFVWNRSTSHSSKVC